MLGAIIGDMVGSVYEYGEKAMPGFPLWDGRQHVTDDSVMTMAVLQALMDGRENRWANLRDVLVKKMVEWYRRYPDCGYGQAFLGWLKGENGYRPYRSFGNGAAMRISPVAWAARDEEEVLRLSKACTDITHDHPEGLKGAACLSMAMFLALKGVDKETIRRRLLCWYPILSDPVALLEKTPRRFDPTCQGTVPQAVACFLTTENEEGAIRKAVLLGGDSDTLACMAGALSEAFNAKERFSSMEREFLPIIPRDFLMAVKAFHVAFDTTKKEAFLKTSL